MKKILNLILVAVFAFAMTSCNKWLDINTDPDNPSDATATCAVRLPWIQHAYGYAYGSASTMAACLTGQQATRGSYMDYADYNVYDYSSGPTTPYQMFYCLAGANFQSLIDKATAEEAWYYVGAAKVVKAMGFVMLVDLYGEVPFTEALGSVLSPAYDDGQTIYSGCIALIDEALEDFAKTQPATATPLSAGDNWNGGDVQKWIKLCHGLKARWLNNMSKLSSYNADDVIAEALAGPMSEAESTVINHRDDLSDTTGDPFIGDPLMSSFVFNVAAWGSWNRMNKWFMNLLTNSYTGGDNTVDPRIHAFVPYCERWKDTNGDGVNDTKYWDMTKGVDVMHSDFRVNDAYAPYGYSFNTKKSDVVERYPISSATDKAAFIASIEGKHQYKVVAASKSSDPDTVEVHYKYRTYYIASDDYLRAGDTAYLQLRSKQAEVVKNYDGISTYYATDADNVKTVQNSGTFYSRAEAPTDVCTYQEMCFILAEAYMRKGNTSSAKDYYQKGIKASIEHVQAKLTSYKGTDADDYAINPYIGPMDAAQIAAFYTSSVYTGAVTMQKIMQQKFIAMMFTLQNWVDMRRFNYSAGNVGSFGVIYQDFDRPYKFRTLTNGAACFPGTSKTDENYWFRRFKQSYVETTYNEAQMLKAQPRAEDHDFWSVPVFWDVD